MGWMDERRKKGLVTSCTAKQRESVASFARLSAPIDELARVYNLLRERALLRWSQLTGLD